MTFDAEKWKKTEEALRCLTRTFDELNSRRPKPTDAEFKRWNLEHEEMRALAGIVRDLRYELVK